MIDEDDEVLDAIDEVAEHAVEGKRDTDVIEVEVEEAEEEVKEIEKMETLAFEEDPEETLNDLKDNTEETVEKLTTEQEEMVERLNSHIEFAGETLALISYNFYCPDCVEDDVYSELDLSFNDGPEWFCETCRESFTPEDDPVPKNRVKDELVEDIWDDLWIEKDDQRRKVYENIEDQKEELKEKEFEQKKEEIRTAWDRIKDVRSKIRDLKTEAEAKKGAIQEIGEVMNKYDRLAQERKEEFEKDVREAAERIDKETEEIIEEMRAYEEKKLQE
ncbi:MAG: hypothetical protein SV760_10010, partial [Halobacteria archaeon]|nr:hypothetical protein [Halobacteria archaeon]